MTLDIDPVQLIINSPKAKQMVQKITSILEEEDHSRVDFYNQISEGDKAEFINGETIFHSPVKLKHNEVSRLLSGLISTYVNLKGLGIVGVEKLMISLTRNDYEPDICFFHYSKSNTFKRDQMRFPAPDFAVEILSKSTAKNDRGVKFEDYATHGVGEYWIIDLDSEMVEQYFLKDGTYQLQVKSNSGDIKSREIKDFVIPIRAIFDQKINTETLQSLIQK